MAVVLGLCGSLVGGWCNLLSIVRYSGSNSLLVPSSGWPNMYMFLHVTFMLINVDPFAREYLGIMFACLCRDDLLHSVFPPDYLPMCVSLRVVRLRNSGVVVVSPDFVSSRISSSLSHMKTRTSASSPST
jgi:hypothetical protein